MIRSTLRGLWDPGPPQNAVTTASRKGTTTVKKDTATVAQTNVDGDVAKIFAGSPKLRQNPPPLTDLSDPSHPCNDERNPLCEVWIPPLKLANEDAKKSWYKTDNEPNPN